MPATRRWWDGLASILRGKVHFHVPRSLLNTVNNKLLYNKNQCNRIAGQIVEFYDQAMLDLNIALSLRLPTATYI